MSQRPRQLRGRSRRRPPAWPTARPRAQRPRTRPAVEDQPGDVWDQRVAAGLAFLRRRLTGDYEVDEFGFDPELTDSVFHPVLRLLYRDWFRTEVFGIENLPDDGRRRWSSATTPAPSRWTR